MPLPGALLVLLPGLVGAIVALDQDDECIDGDDSSHCSVSALQLRARRGKTYDFDQYILEFHKTYKPGSEEYERRKSIFEANMLSVEAHSRDSKSSYVRGVNTFSDWSKEEFRKLLGYHKGQAWLSSTSLGGSSQQIKGVTSNLTDLPLAWDWRNKGVITPVKEQSYCGSCWAFASVETLESFAAIRTGLLQELSVEQVVACSSNTHHCGGEGGCDGSTGQLALDYVKSEGIASAWLAPYTAALGEVENCSELYIDEPRVTITGYRVLTNVYDAVLRALAEEGPLIAAVAAESWQDYTGGVFDGCGINGSNVDINHLVQLVGYGMDPKGGDYWLIRNSWGVTWGEKGYIRLQRSSQAECYVDSTPANGIACEDDMPEFQTVCGMCGVLFDVIYPQGVDVVGAGVADVRR